MLSRVNLQFFKNLALKNSSFLGSRNFNVGVFYCSEISNEKNFKKPLNNDAFKPVKKSDDLPDILTEKDVEVINSLKKGNIFHPYKGPKDRLIKITMEDLKAGGRSFIHHVIGIKTKDHDIKYFPRYTDIVIVGSGIIGLSVAYALRTEFPHGPNIIVVDKDIDAPFHSLNLGVATLSQLQFTDEKDIEMSQYCAEFLSSFHRHTMMPKHDGCKVMYEPLGSLLLADEEYAEELLMKHSILNELGIPNKLLESEELKSKFSWLNAEGVVVGCLGMLNEGLFDPWKVLMGMKSKLINLGVQFVTANVIDFGMNAGRFNRVICKLPDETYNSIDFAYCVIAAGMGSVKLLDIINNFEEMLIKLKLPLQQMKRYEYCFHKPNGPGLNTPIVVNPDGTYFRREGLNGFYVAGIPSLLSEDGKSDGIFEIFNEKIKPFLMTKLKDFHECEIRHGWIDTYDYNSANGVGVIGPHPFNQEILFATGFTKQGFLHGPAVGRGLMEYMYYDEYKTIDFTPFHIENMYQKQHMEAEEKRQKLIQSQRVASLNEK